MLLPMKTKFSEKWAENFKMLTSTNANSILKQARVAEQGAEYIEQPV